MPMHRLIRTARSTPHLAPRASRPPFPEPPSRFLARPARMPLRRLSATRRSSGRSMARWKQPAAIPAARAGNINIVMARPRERPMPCDRLTGIKAREKPPLFRCRLRLRRTPMFRWWCRSILRQNMQQWDIADAPSCGRGRTAFPDRGEQISCRCVFVPYGRGPASGALAASRRLSPVPETFSAHWRNSCCDFEPSLQHLSPAGQNALPCIKTFDLSPAVPIPRVNGIPPRNLPRAERYEAGRALRKRVAREPCRLPAGIRLRRSAILHRDRWLAYPELLPIRYERMLQSPSPSCRARAVMAHDLATSLRLGAHVQACGDCI